MSLCGGGQPQVQEVDGRMGRDVPAIVVSQADRRRYREKVRSCLDVLARMLRESQFPTGPEQVGLEVEFYLVDEAGAPAMRNTDVLAAIGDPDWSPELGRFNIEVNLAPRLLAGDALATLEHLLTDSYNRADVGARQFAARPAMIGILPSLREHHATEEADVAQSAVSAAQRADLRGPRRGDADIHRGAGAAADARGEHHAGGRLHQRAVPSAGKPGAVRQLLERSAGGGRGAGRARRELAVPVRPGTVAGAA